MQGFPALLEIRGVSNCWTFALKGKVKSFFLHKFAILNDYLGIKLSALTAVQINGEKNEKRELVCFARAFFPLNLTNSAVFEGVKHILS